MLMGLSCNTDNRRKIDMMIFRCLNFVSSVFIKLYLN